MFITKQFNPSQMNELMAGMPYFELSYEIISHKKVYPTDHSVAIAVSTGKKCCAWFSFDNHKDVCYLLQFDKNKKIQKMGIANCVFPTTFSLGTIIYGTIHNNVFLTEDIFYYKGICLKNVLFSDKLGCIKNMLQELRPYQETTVNKLMFSVPCMWNIHEHKTNNEMIFINDVEFAKQTVNYNIHHIQTLKLNDFSPRVNVSINMKSHDNQSITSSSSCHVSSPSTISTTSTTSMTSMTKHHHHHHQNTFKPQYKQLTTFCIDADMQNDVYNLYALSLNNSFINCGVACIPDIKTSVMMNNLFRNIRENNNLDCIEESDDEDDFENIAIDKHIDLNKKINMVCSYHQKFKKWVPLRISNENVVHINKL